MKKHNRNRRGGRDESKTFLESFLFKALTKVFLGVIVIALILTLIQCTVEKPEAPSWNMSLEVPVINRTYNMDELISKIDQEEIVIDSSGNISFSITQDLDTVFLQGTNLTNADLNFAIADSLGPIRIATPTVNPISVNLSDIGSLAASFPGDTGLVPDTNFAIITDLDPISSFTTAVVSSGRVDITITNELGLDLDNVSIDLVSNITNSILTSGTLSDTLYSGQAGVIPLILDGITLPFLLRVVSRYHTPASIIDSFSTRYLSTSVLFSNTLEVSQALAEVPPTDPIVFNQQVALDVGPGEQIDSASLSSGNLTLSVVNNTPLDANLLIVIPELRSNGVGYQLNSLILAGQSTNVIQDLSGYTLVPTAGNINIGIVTDSLSSGGQQIQIDQNDNFSISAGISNLAFASVSGIFAGTEAPFDNITQALDVPDGFDNIGLVSATLTLEIDNGIDLPGQLDILLSGNNGKSLSLTGNIDPSGILATRKTTITNNNVADFLSPLPDTITVSGSVSFGDSSYQGTINANDFLFARIKIYAPLEVKINNVEVTDLDLQKKAINQEDIGIITDHLIEARFIYEITNHLPLGATTIIHFSGDSLSLFSSPQFTLDTIVINPAPVSSGTGIVSGALITSGELFIDQSDLQVLNNDTLYIRTQLFLNGSDTAGVKLTSQDYITIFGRIQIEYLFDGEF